MWHATEFAGPLVSAGGTEQHSVSCGIQGSLLATRLIPTIAALKSRHRWVCNMVYRCRKSAYSVIGPTDRKMGSRSNEMRRRGLNATRTSLW